MNDHKRTITIPASKIYHDILSQFAKYVIRIHYAKKIVAYIYIYYIYQHLSYSTNRSVSNKHIQHLNQSGQSQKHIRMTYFEILLCSCVNNLIYIYIYICCMYDETRWLGAGVFSSSTEFVPWSNPSSDLLSITLLIGETLNINGAPRFRTMSQTPIRWKSPIKQRNKYLYVWTANIKSSLKL